MSRLIRYSTPFRPWYSWPKDRFCPHLRPATSNAVVFGLFPSAMLYSNQVEASAPIDSFPKIGFLATAASIDAGAGSGFDTVSESDLGTSSPAEAATGLNPPLVVPLLCLAPRSPLAVFRRAWRIVSMVRSLCCCARPSVCCDGELSGVELVSYDGGVVMPLVEAGERSGEAARS